VVDTGSALVITVCEVIVGAGALALTPLLDVTVVPGEDVVDAPPLAGSLTMPLDAALELLDPLPDRSNTVIVVGDDCPGAVNEPLKIGLGSMLPLEPVKEEMPLNGAKMSRLKGA